MVTSACARTGTPERDDRVNRGSHWFDFEDLSDFEEQEEEQKAASKVQKVLLEPLAVADLEEELPLQRPAAREGLTGAAEAESEAAAPAAAEQREEQQEEPQEEQEHGEERGQEEEAEREEQAEEPEEPEERGQEEEQQEEQEEPEEPEEPEEREEREEPEEPEEPEEREEPEEPEEPAAPAGSPDGEEGPAAAGSLEAAAEAEAEPDVAAATEGAVAVVGSPEEEERPAAADSLGAAVEAEAELEVAEPEGAVAVEGSQEEQERLAAAEGLEAAVEAEAELGADGTEGAVAAAGSSEEQERLAAAEGLEAAVEAEAELGAAGTEEAVATAGSSEEQERPRASGWILDEGVMLAMDAEQDAGAGAEQDTSAGAWGELAECAAPEEEEEAQAKPGKEGSSAVKRPAAAPDASPPAVVVRDRPGGGEKQLRDILHAARPNWSLQDVTAVERKLQTLGIHRSLELAEALGEQLNERLRGAGYKAFSVDTMNALQQSLTLELQCLEACVAPAVPDLQRPRASDAAEERLLCSDAFGLPRGRCQMCRGCSCCVLAGRSHVQWRLAESEDDEEGGAGAPKPEAPPSMGDRVEVSSDGSEAWRPGVVIWLDPLKVRLEGGGDEEAGAGWNMLRKQTSREKASQDKELKEACKACDRCGCAVSSHEDLSYWHAKVKRAITKFRATGKNTSLKVPRESAVPAAALEWPPEDVAFYVLTDGVFDPRYDGRFGDGVGGLLQEEHGGSSSSTAPGPPADPAVAAAPAAPGGKQGQRRTLISVVTPTSEARQDFHPLLYECFRTQTYEPKELVVIDSGTKPSEFFLERARSDKRVVYRFWPVADARVQDLAECVWDGAEDTPEPSAQRGFGGVWRPLPQGQGQRLLAPWDRRPAFDPKQLEAKRDAQKLRNRLKGKVRSGQRQEGWSLGMKRNLACHLARGDAIAHFDDDDLYASCYLEVMLSKLVGAIPTTTDGRLHAAAATLEAWHVLDLADQTFGFFRPRTEPLLDKERAESFTYGFGFSYVYSRAAWELEPFADVEWSEDGAFTDQLMQKGKVVKLVNPELVPRADALAAHSHHGETTSGGEFVEMTTSDLIGRKQYNYSVRMGTKVGVPQALKGLLTMVREIVAKKNILKGKAHPTRQRIAGNTITAEVGLQEKQGFLKRYEQPKGTGGRSGPGASAPFFGKGKVKGKGKGKGGGRMSHWGMIPGWTKPRGY